MAIHLRKGGNCTVLLPQWLDIGMFHKFQNLYLITVIIDYLERVLKEEREKPDEFSPIHYFWMEIYSLLMQW